MFNSKKITEKAPEQTPEKAPEKAAANAPAAPVPVAAAIATPAAETGDKATPKAEQSRANILDAALRLFRKNGFDSTTMREIAAEAGVALGGTYYYFPSKEAIVLAYYDRVQAEHHQRVADGVTDGKLNFKDRLRLAFHTKLDVLQSDRLVLGALLRYMGEPLHPLSPLGPNTRATREDSIATFALAIGNERLPEDLRRLLPMALYGLHLAILLFLIYDSSPHQQRTRKLTDGALDLVVSAISLAKNPLLKPVRGKLVFLLQDVDLLPTAASTPALNQEEL